jgi:saccharopine dehydrogenase-like NADP-dependent oxidoreductase
VAPFGSPTRVSKPYAPSYDSLYNCRTVQIILTFRHNVKTSRRFVFENIMDLDHVCTLHKRWFRNLRIVAQGPDYVEYRLTSLFYGVKQETRARGGPVDEHRYWYEFETLLAKMRVDGLMEGKDGNLTQTETITFGFHWLLAPLFWAMCPLFKKQKEDILRDDSALLERVYELESAGFKRLETHLPKVVVYGGDGFFGHLVVEDLLNYSLAEITIASRHPKPKTFHDFNMRVHRVESDINDYGSVLSTIEGAKVVISCIGPYQGQSLNLIRACTEKHIAYVDVADDRDFVERCHHMAPLIEAAGIPAFVGCSVVPGMSSLLTRYGQKEVSSIESTRIFISPGTKRPRGPGSFLCLLSTVGNEFPIPNGSYQRRVHGWTGRERVRFPFPMGQRWVYFVVDVADYFLQPIYFGVRNVEFKIGSELDILNRILSGLRQFKEALDLKNIDFLMPMSRALIYAASLFGTSQGGVMVEVSGKSNGRERTMWLSVLSEEKGQVIPALLPSLAAQMLLRGEVTCRGIVPLPDWLSRERFVEELSKRRLKMAEKTDGIWMACN